MHTLARKGFADDNPEVGKWLKNFKMTEKQLTEPRGGDPRRRQGQGAGRACAPG